MNSCELNDLIEEIMGPEWTAVFTVLVDDYRREVASDCGFLSVDSSGESVSDEACK